MAPEDLIKPFKLPFANFSSPIEWSDGLGFSTTQDYGDGYGSLYKFGILDQTSKENRENLWITVSYGKETDGGISLGTGKNGIWDPIDLNFNNEFFYDKSTKKFYHYEKEVEPKKILLDIEKLHKLSTKKFKGALLRARLNFWRKFLPSLVNVIDKTTIFVLLLVSGEKPIEVDITKRWVSQWHEEHKIERLNEKIIFEKAEFKPVSFNEGELLNFYVFKAKRWSVVFYCAIHLIFYIIFFFFKIKFDLLNQISKNSFIFLCYIVVTFTFTEATTPWVLKKIIKKNSEIFSRVSFKTLRIHSFW
jgi:hypothetical protein